jgi:hypothetical protein
VVWQSFLSVFPHLSGGTTATSQTCCHLPGEPLNSAAECADRARIGIKPVSVSLFVRNLSKRRGRIGLNNVIIIIHDINLFENSRDVWRRIPTLVYELTIHNNSLYSVKCAIGMITYRGNAPHITVQLFQVVILIGRKRRHLYTTLAT